MDMIDFGEVEEMHGGDNGTERNEVSVYSAPHILGCLDTSAQLPIMRLEGEYEPTCEHYLSQMGEQNQYNVTGVNDRESYLDTWYSRSDWNPKIKVGQIFFSKRVLLTELRLTALRGHFEFNVQFSCTKRVLVVCCQRTCPWRVRASRIGEFNFMTVRCKAVNKCDLRFVNDNHRQATAVDRTRPEFPKTRDEPCGDPGITPTPGSLLKTMSSFTIEDLGHETFCPNFGRVSPVN
ncbi:unnamed protein product [Prunus armeniaca]